jgi:uncharacterized protein YbaA (DUF1428 family)
MYVQGFVLPVPADKKDEYTALAAAFWDILKDFGALGQFECWEADVKDGTHTDFRRAVDLQPGEQVVFSWITWPDRATADASHDKMRTDPRMDNFTLPMPFDGKRMIIGGFDPLLWSEV